MNLMIGLMDDVGGDRANRPCCGFCSVPGPLQTGQRAEFWGVILALQAADGVHRGVDNLGVVRQVGRLLDGNVGSCPAELVKDGDLVWRCTGGTLSEFLRSRGMLTRVRLGKVGFVTFIAWVLMQLMRRLIWSAEG